MHVFIIHVHFIYVRFYYTCTFRIQARLSARVVLFMEIGLGIIYGAVFFFAGGIWGYVTKNYCDFFCVIDCFLAFCEYACVYAVLWRDWFRYHRWRGLLFCWWHLGVCKNILISSVCVILFGLVWNVHVCLPRLVFHFGAVFFFAGGIWEYVNKHSDFLYGIDFFLALCEMYMCICWRMTRSVSV